MYSTKVSNNGLGKHRSIIRSIFLFPLCLLVINLALLSSDASADMPSNVQEYEHVYTISANWSAAEEEINIAIQTGAEFLASLPGGIIEHFLKVPFEPGILLSIIGSIPIVSPDVSADIDLIVNGQILEPAEDNAVGEVGVGQFFLPIVFYSSGSYYDPPGGLPFNIWVQKWNGFGDWEAVDYLPLFRDEPNPFNAFVIPKNPVRVYEPGLYRVIVDNWVEQRFIVTTEIPSEYRVDVLEPTNGSISPCCNEVVSQGNSIAYNATPDFGYV